MSKFLTVIILVATASIIFAAFTPPADPNVFLTITRVTTSETRSLDYLPDIDGGWDLGDTESAITENYGGNPFLFGKPCQIEVWITAPDVGDSWEYMSLQYIVGTNSGASVDWVTIGTITNGFNSITNVLGCHFGMSWTPPVVGNYLVRIYGQTTNSVANANLGAQNIDSKGDGLTWDNHEVVGFTVTSNTRPGGG